MYTPRQMTCKGDSNI